MKQQAVLGTLFILASIGVWLLMVIVFFPHILDCKDKGEAVVVDVSTHTKKDDDGKLDTYYTPTYEIEGMVIESHVSSTKVLEKGDIVSVRYNTEYQVCYNNTGLIIYWIFIAVSVILLIFGLLCWKDVIWKILQVTVIAWLAYKQQNGE